MVAAGDEKQLDLLGASPKVGSFNYKITVSLCIKPGCLGPDGNSFIEDFCIFAEMELGLIHADIIHWEIEPRFEKDNSEMHYKFNDKSMPRSKVEKYLGSFKIDIDDFEAELQEILALLIEQFMESQGMGSQASTAS